MSSAHVTNTPGSSSWQKGKYIASFRSNICGMAAPTISSVNERRKKKKIIIKHCCLNNVDDHHTQNESNGDNYDDDDRKRNIIEIAKTTKQI